MIDPTQRFNLSEMMEMQGKYSSRVRLRKSTIDSPMRQGLPETEQEKIHWSKEYGFAAMAEVVEMVDKLKWKPHRTEHHYDTFDLDGFAEEGMDVVNYVMAMLHMWGLTGEDLQRIWAEKYAVLEQREYQEITNPIVPGMPIVMVDLDGCIANFRQGISDWLKQGGHVPHEHVDPVVNYNMDLDYALDPLVYRKLKWEFEKDGGYNTLPPFPEAERLLRAAEAFGEIVFVTSRVVPLTRVYRDTLMWIRRNFPWLKFQLVITDKKAEWLQNTRADVQFCIEDEPKMVRRLESAGFLTYVPAHPYNEMLESDILIRRDLHSLICNELEYSIGMREMEMEEYHSES